MQTENYQRITQHAEGMSLRYGVIVLRNLTQPPTKKSFYHQGFFAVKRRAVFMVQWINTGGTETKNIKKQPFSDASASHLSLVLWHVRFQAGA